MFFKPVYTSLKYDGYIYYNNPTSITMQDSKKMNENIKQYDFMVELKILIYHVTKVKYIKF